MKIIILIKFSEIKHDSTNNFEKVDKNENNIEKMTIIGSSRTSGIGTLIYKKHKLIHL